MYEELFYILASRVFALAPIYARQRVENLHGNACYADYRFGENRAQLHRKPSNKTKYWSALRSIIYYRGYSHLTSNNVVNIK